jgi:hypothetical protein
MDSQRRDKAFHLLWYQVKPMERNYIRTYLYREISAGEERLLHPSSGSCHYILYIQQLHSAFTCSALCQTEKVPCLSPYHVVVSRLALFQFEKVLHDLLVAQSLYYF